MNRPFYIKLAGFIFALSLIASSGMNPAFIGSTVHKPASGGGGGGGTAFIVSGHGSTTQAGNFAVGYEFVPGVNMTITAVGLMMISGNTGSHVVYIKSAEALCTIIATSSAINFSGQTPGNYIYVTLGTPVSLTSGTHYQIQGDYFTGSDLFYNDNVTLTPTSDGTISESTYYDGTSCHINTSGRFGFIGPNFKYTSP